MEKKAFVFLAEGFEEIEAVTAIDILRRAGIATTIVSVMETLTVTGAHGVPYTADALLAEVADQKVDALVLPGGLPGADNLLAATTLRAMLTAQHERQELIAAICASPAVVLGSLGILEGKHATCYPSFEPKMTGAHPVAKPVVCDGHIITGQGPASSMAFALEVVAALTDEATRQEVADGLLYCA